jgi:glycosyltransferase involved in cell wall biosynthesis
VWHWICHTFFKKYNDIHSLLLGYFRARHFSRKLRRGNYTMVFASACSPIVAFLKTDVPIVYLSDATFNLVVDYYDQFSGLSKLSLLEGQYAERKAIDKSTAIVLSSEWARQSAINDYGADPDKVETCLFGANIDINAVNKVSDYSGKIDTAGRACNLLFLARDWQRKGGQVALDAFKQLKRSGYAVTLTICGCEPEERETMDGLEVITYLDKSQEDDKRRYHDIMNKSHFLVLPTVADCTPMVFAEANAYGMPVITTRTGGIPSLIRVNENGYLLPEEADGAAYADVVVRNFFEDPDRYRSVVKSSRERYEQALTWENWGACLERFVDRRLSAEAAFALNR